MSYIINTYNGTQLTVIPDGTTFDTSTEITLVGKNYSGYGTIQNENFLYMLENFSNTIAPTKPITGQLWYDSGTNKLKFYDKNAIWRGTSGADTSSGEPAYLTEGDFWFDTIKKQLYVYTSTGYVLVGPLLNKTGATEFGVITVTDTDINTHEIITATINGNTIYTISNDATFTLLPGTSAIDGFEDIHPGITLANTTDPLNPGYTTPGVVAYKYYGTATNTDTINVKKSDGTIFPVALASTSIPSTFDKTSVVARDSVGDIYANILHGAAAEALTMQIHNDSNILDSIQATTFIPTTPNKTSVVVRTATGQISASQFNGVATEANTLFVGNAYVGASPTTTPNTIVARNSNGDIYVNTMHGVATEALTMQVNTNNNTILVDSIAATTHTPSTADKTSIVARNSNGIIRAAGLIGVASEASTLFFGGTYVGADAAPSANTIVARDGIGDIYASTFQGASSLALTMQVQIVGGIGLINHIQATTFIPTTPDKTSIVVRTDTGAVNANEFNGQFNGQLNGQLNGSVSSTTTATTQAPADNSTLLATTEFVNTKINTSSIGISQSWRDVTSARLAGTVYTNSTSRPIQVIITWRDTGGTAYASFNVGGTQSAGPVITGGLDVIPPVAYDVGSGSATFCAQVIVPVGETYGTHSSGYSTWVELR